MRNDCPPQEFSTLSARQAEWPRDSIPRIRLPIISREKPNLEISSWSCPTAVLTASAESCSASCRNAAPRRERLADDSHREQLETGCRTDGPALRRASRAGDNRLLRLGCPPGETSFWNNGPRAERARPRGPPDACLECSLPDPRLFFPYVT